MLKAKIALNAEKAKREAAKKAKEKELETQKQLKKQQEERKTRDVVSKMVVASDNGLAPITKVLVNYEGNYILAN